MGNYSFDADLKIAKRTEKEIARDIFAEAFGEDCLIEFSNGRDYDIRFAVGGIQYTVEVKEDFKCIQTGNVCVEYECRGKPSGIAVSKANFFLYKVHETPKRFSYYMCPTSHLRQAIKDELYFRTFTFGGDEGSGTKGYLFKLDTFKTIMTQI